MKKRYMNHPGKNIMFVCIAVLQVLFLVMITGFAREADYTAMDWKWIPVIFLVMCGMADGILFSSVTQMKKRKLCEQKNQMMNQELEEQLKHYDQILEHLEKMSRFRHDFANYIQTVYLLIDRGEYKEARDMLDAYSKSVQDIQF